MPSIVTCVCGARFQAADSLAGKTVTCPTCGNPLTVRPARAGGSDTVASPTSGPRVHCNGCGGSFAAAPHLSGTCVPCPHCGSQIQVHVESFATTSGPNDPLFADDLPRCDSGSRLLPTSTPFTSPKRPAKKKTKAVEGPPSDAKRAGLGIGIGLVVLGIAITAWAVVTWDASLAADKRVGTGIAAIVFGGILSAFFALGGRVQ